MKDKLFDLITKNLKNPRLYVFLFVLVLIVLLLFPYIDANFLYYRRVSNRVEILTKMTEIDLEKVEENSILKQEYNSLLTEIEKQKEGSIGSIVIKDSNPNTKLIKLITGGVPFWLLALLCLLYKKHTWKNRFISFIVLIVLGFFFGWVSKNIPTIINPMVNYIVFPLLLITLFALLITGSTKQMKNDSSK